MLNFLRGYRTINLIFIPLLGIALWMNAFLNPEIKLFAFDNNPMPLYALLSGFIAKSHMLSTALAFLTLMLMVYLATRINKQFLIVETRSYIMAVFLVILSCSFLPLLRIHPGLIGGVFLLLAIEKCLRSYHSDKFSTNFFDAAFYISVGSLFYFSLIYFTLLIWIAIIILRPFKLREYLMVPVGILLPYIFAWAYYFFTDNQSALFEVIAQNTKLTSYLNYLNISNYLFFSFILILTILASLHLLNEMGSRKIGPRKFLRVMFWVFSLSIIAVLFVPSISIELLPIVAIPLSILFANYFTRIRNMLIGNVLITVLILLIIGIHSYPLIIHWLQ